MPMTDQVAFSRDAGRDMHAVSAAALKNFAVASTPRVNPKDDPYYKIHKSKGETLTRAARKAAIEAFKKGECAVTAVNEMRAKGVQVKAAPVVCKFN